MGKVSNCHFLNRSSSLSSSSGRIALTGVHPHMKLGRDIEFGDAQGIGILKFV